MVKMSKRETTQRKILDAADALFAQHGYKGVSLRDIARETKLRHTAVYYYAESKEDLYIQVMERRFQQHRAAMTAVIADAGDDLAVQMRAVGEWLMGQTQLNASHMLQSDFVALAPQHADRLSRLLFEALAGPLAEALDAAQAQGIIQTANTELAAISFVSLMQTVSVTQFTRVRDQRAAIIDNTVELLLNGLLVR